MKAIEDIFHDMMDIPNSKVRPGNCDLMEVKGKWSIRVEAYKRPIY